MTRKTEAAQATLSTTKRKATTAATREVKLPDIEVKVVTLTIRGISSLIVNNFNEKIQRELEDKRKGEAPAERKPRNPDEEFQNARIRDGKGRDCLPSRWFKAALVTACGFTNKQIKKNIVNGTVYVLGDMEPIKSKSGASPRKDMVRVGKWGNKQPDIRYRAEFEDWEVTFRVQFEPSMVSLQQLLYLVRRAGYNVGLCEWRPEKAGQFGRFELVT